jgi:hypothetical protein
MNVVRTPAKALLGASMLLGSAIVSAQDPAENIYAPCAAIADDRERLACFDRTYAKATTIIAERTEAKRKAEAEEFGLTPKQIRERSARVEAGETGTTASVAATPAGEEGNAKVSSKVAEVLTDALGNYVVILENGQIWRSTANKSFRGKMRVGWQVEIEKIWSGGFRMTFKEKSGFLGVSRVR